MEKRKYEGPIQNRKARVAIIGALAGFGLLAGAGEKFTNSTHPRELKEYPVVSQVEEFDSAKHEEEMAHADDLEDARATAVVSPGRLEEKVTGISQVGLNLVKKFEGFEPKPYPCPAGVLTIGYGHVIRKGEKFGEISEGEARALLRKDMKPFEEAVRKYVDVELDQGQFDALASFAYNEGANAFRKSTLLKKLNRGDYSGASAEFPRWNKATVNGEKISLKGLTSRRAEERKLFD